MVRLAGLVPDTVLRIAALVPDPVVTIAGGTLDPVVRIDGLGSLSSRAGTVSPVDMVGVVASVDMVVVGEAVVSELTAATGMLLKCFLWSQQIPAIWSFKKKMFQL